MSSDGGAHSEFGILTMSWIWRIATDFKRLSVDNTSSLSLFSSSLRWLNVRHRCPHPEVKQCAPIMTESLASLCFSTLQSLSFSIFSSSLHSHSPSISVSLHASLLHSRSVPRCFMTISFPVPSNFSVTRSPSSSIPV